MKRKDTGLRRLQGGRVHGSPRLRTGCSVTVLSLSPPPLLRCVLPPLKYTHRGVTAICPQIRICGLLKPPKHTPRVTYCTSRPRATTAAAVPPGEHYRGGTCFFWGSRAQVLASPGTQRQVKGMPVGAGPLGRAAVDSCSRQLPQGSSFLAAVAFQFWWL